MSDTNWAFIALLFFEFLTFLFGLFLWKKAKELSEPSEGLIGKTAEGKVKEVKKLCDEKRELGKEVKRLKAQRQYHKNKGVKK